MADPLADFRTFFADDFQRLLESTEIPGMEGASWDRRAAWLLFNGFNPAVDETPRREPVLRRRRTTTVIVEDDFGGLV